MSDLREVSLIFRFKSGKTLTTDVQIMDGKQTTGTVEIWLSFLSGSNAFSFVSGGSLHLVSPQSVDYIVFDMQEHDEDSE